MLTIGPFNAVAGLRHAFFTREGGVSQGIYASLNCGLGSGDNPAHVTENRSRAAEALGAEPGSSAFAGAARQVPSRRGGASC